MGTLIKWAISMSSILILLFGYILIARASVKCPYDRVPVCKGLEMRKDEIQNNPQQFLKEALAAIKIAQAKQHCQI